MEVWWANSFSSAAILELEAKFDISSEEWRLYYVFWIQCSQWMNKIFFTESPIREEGWNREDMGEYREDIENRAGGFFLHEKRESPAKIGRVGTSESLKIRMLYSAPWLFI